LWGKGGITPQSAVLQQCPADDDIVFTIDDDIVYPPDYVNQTMTFFQQLPADKHVLGYMGNA
jgi:hypothetical protein